MGAALTGVFEWSPMAEAVRLHALCGFGEGFYSASVLSEGQLAREGNPGVCRPGGRRTEKRQALRPQIIRPPSSETIPLTNDLHDLITRCKGPAEPLDLALAGGIECCLQLDVE